MYSAQELNIDTKLNIIKGTALGMLHLHKNGIVHRDLATRNILVNFDNRSAI